MEFYAVQGCKFELSSGQGNVICTTAPSSKMMIGGKGVYIGTINLTIAAYTNGTITNGTGSGVLTGTSKNKSLALPIVRENDETLNDIVVTGVDVSGNTVTALVKVKISDAGQKLVKGE